MRTVEWSTCSALGKGKVRQPGSDGMIGNMQPHGESAPPDSHPIRQSLLSLGAGKVDPSFRSQGRSFPAADVGRPLHHIVPRRRTYSSRILQSLGDADVRTL